MTPPIGGVKNTPKKGSKMAKNGPKMAKNGINLRGALKRLSIFWFLGVRPPFLAQKGGSKRPPIDFFFGPNRVLNSIQILLPFGEIFLKTLIGPEKKVDWAGDSIL